MIEDKQTGVNKKIPIWISANDKIIKYSQRKVSRLHSCRHLRFRGRKKLRGIFK